MDMNTDELLPRLLSTKGKVLVALLEFHDDGFDPYVDDIAKKVGTATPVTARHLESLVRMGIARRKRRGPKVYYEIFPFTAEDVSAYVRLCQFLTSERGSVGPGPDPNWADWGSLANPDIAGPTEGHPV